MANQSQLIALLMQRGLSKEWAELCVCVIAADADLVEALEGWCKTGELPDHPTVHGWTPKSLRGRFPDIHPVGTFLDLWADRHIHPADYEALDAERPVVSRPDPAVR